MASNHEVGSSSLSGCTIALSKFVLGGMQHSQKRTKLLASLFIVIGLAGLIGAYLLYLSQPKEPKSPYSNSNQTPSSTKPSQQSVDSYSVAANLPKYINIPDINVTKSRIVQLGLKKNNQIAEPDNIYDTGWYNTSSKPGQSGAMFIFGHVSSWKANGVFYDLKKLQTGKRITITRGDSQVFTYQVISSKIYPYKNVDMKAVLSPVDPSRPGLNLMTCTGNIIKGTNEFDERVVMFTSLVKS
jgi:sortase (surface protein transpeptidase)